MIRLIGQSDRRNDVPSAPAIRLYTNSRSDLVAGKGIFVEETLIHHSLYRPEWRNLHNELHSHLLPSVNA